MAAQGQIEPSPRCWTTSQLRRKSHPATSWSAAQVRPYPVIRTKRSMPSPPIVNGAPDDREPLDVIMSLLPAKDEINSPSATQDCIRDA